MKDSLILPPGPPYATHIPPWAGQVTSLPPGCYGARNGELCSGYALGCAVFGESTVPAFAAFAYCWRRFGPPWWGSDEDKDLACYILHTPQPDVLLTLALSASPLPYAVGYLVTQAVMAAWRAPRERWEAQFEAWWLTTTRPTGEAAPGAPDLRTQFSPYWAARNDDSIVRDAEAVIGPYPRHGSPLVRDALTAALIECLRPVKVRDIAINILGCVPDAALATDTHDACPRSVYAGDGIPKAAMDEQCARNRNQERAQ